MAIDVNGGYGEAPKGQDSLRTELIGLAETAIGAGTQVSVHGEGDAIFQGALLNGPTKVRDAHVASLDGDVFTVWQRRDGIYEVKRCIGPSAAEGKFRAFIRGLIHPLPRPKPYTGKTTRFNHNDNAGADDITSYLYQAS